MESKPQNADSKLAYEKPRLISHGDLQKITRGQNGGAGDASGHAGRTKITPG
jgi:hypothetical protein